jgi:hypothetical protein
MICYTVCRTQIYTSDVISLKPKLTTTTNSFLVLKAILLCFSLQRSLNPPPEAIKPRLVAGTVLGFVSTRWCTCLF